VEIEEQQPPLGTKTPETAAGPDREDDPDDLREDSPLKSKEDKSAEVKQEEYLFSDFNKLENLKIMLEEKLGIDPFLQAYRIIRHELEIVNDVNELEKKYSKADTLAHLFPKLDRHVIETYLPLLFTFIITEDLAVLNRQ
jgi:hypothetical protein